MIKMIKPIAIHLLVVVASVSCGWYALYSVVDKGMKEELAFLTAVLILTPIITTAILVSNIVDKAKDSVDDELAIEFEKSKQLQLEVRLMELKEREIMMRRK